MLGEGKAPRVRGGGTNSIWVCSLFPLVHARSHEDKPCPTCGARMTLMDVGSRSPTLDQRIGGAESPALEEFLQDRARKRSEGKRGRGPKPQQE